MAVTRGAGGVVRVEWLRSGVLLRLRSVVSVATGRRRKELRLMSGHERLPTFRASSRCVIGWCRFSVRGNTTTWHREFLQRFDMGMTAMLLGQSQG